MTNQKQVDNYIRDAMAFPVKDERQLLSMVLLHFSDLNGDIAERMVAESVRCLKPIFWNPHRYE